jgi:hypothetical protein
MKQLMVAVVALVALSLGACSSDGPAVKAAKKLVAQATDERKANDVRQAAWPEPVRCDAGTPNLSFIDAATDEPLVFYVKNDDGRILCFDRPGFYTKGTKMGAVLMPVTRAVVAEILAQPCPPPPPAPRVVPTPTPLPELGEGHCCGR